MSNKSGLTFSKGTMGKKAWFLSAQVWLNPVKFKPVVVELLIGGY